MPIPALAVGLPAINSLLGSFIIGKVLESTALSAIGYSGPFISIVSGLSSLVGIDSQILCGKYLGSGNENSIKKLLTQHLQCVCSLEQSFS